MENSNRNDVLHFFKDMPPEMQQVAIDKMKRQIKKPPDAVINDYSLKETESEGGPVISELSVK